VPADAPAPETPRATGTGTDTAPALAAPPASGVAPRLASAPAPVTAPAPASAPAPPPPAAQLHGVLRDLRRAEDGSYEMRLELRPPELGRVDVRVELRDGVLHATIRTEHAHTADIVRGALDDLRARLGTDGMHAGQLNVEDGGTQRRREQSPAREHTDDRAPEPPAPGLAAAQPDETDTTLDVRI
jgi:flagellar hook-length control protein FliK